MRRIAFLVLFGLAVISTATSARAQVAFAPNIRDFDVLKIGATYRTPSEYCHAERDLRDVFAIHKSSGYLKALERWREKTAAKLCVEDPLKDSTEFRVVKLVETYNFDGTMVYIVEVVINGSTAFATSPIPVVPAG